MLSQRLDVFFYWQPTSLLRWSVSMGAALRIVTMVSLLNRHDGAGVASRGASRTRQDPKLMASYLRHAARAVPARLSCSCASSGLEPRRSYVSYLGTRYTGAVGIVRILLLGTVAIRSLYATVTAVPDGKRSRGACSTYPLPATRDRY